MHNVYKQLISVIIPNKGFRKQINVSGIVSSVLILFSPILFST